MTITIVCGITNNITFNVILYFQAFEELEDLLAKHDICIAVKERLVKDSGVAGEIAYDNIVQKLLTKPRARGECTYYLKHLLCSE